MKGDLWEVELECNDGTRIKELCPGDDLCKAVKEAEGFLAKNYPERGARAVKAEFFTNIEEDEKNMVDVTTPVAKPT